MSKPDNMINLVHRARVHCWLVEKPEDEKRYSFKGREGVWRTTDKGQHIFIPDDATQDEIDGIIDQYAYGAKDPEQEKGYRYKDKKAGKEKLKQMRGVTDEFIDEWNIDDIDTDALVAKYKDLYPDIDWEAVESSLSKDIESQDLPDKLQKDLINDVSDEELKKIREHYGSEVDGISDDELRDMLETMGMPDDSDESNVVNDILRKGLTSSEEEFKDYIDDVVDDMRDSKVEQPKMGRLARDIVYAFEDEGQILKPEEVDRVLEQMPDSEFDDVADALNKGDYSTILNYLGSYSDEILLPQQPSDDVEDYDIDDVDKKINSFWHEIHTRRQFGMKSDQEIIDKYKKKYSDINWNAVYKQGDSE